MGASDLRFFPLGWVRRRQWAGVPHPQPGSRHLLSTRQPRAIPAADHPPRLDTQPIPDLARRQPPAPPPATAL